MKKQIVIIGVGEMAGVFARGFLRCGYPVYPILRETDLAAAADALPDPELVLVAVGESDLDLTLSQIPPVWSTRLALLQNELLPPAWQRHGIDEPTVISVWFEKKRGQDVKVLISSPIHGPLAHCLSTALQSLGIPNHTVSSAQEMLFELVCKNLYIVTTNIAGLVVGGTVSELWSQHEQLTRDIADEALAIQQWLTQSELPREPLIDGMLKAFAGDPDHRCMGRSAPARLERAIHQAATANLNVPTLKKVAASIR